MTKLLLSLLAIKFFNPRLRRVLVLGSFYSILRSNLDCSAKMSELNKDFNFAADTKSLLLAAELPHILWDKKKCSELQTLPPEKLKRYYRELLPHWLKYDLEENGFDIDADLTRALEIFNRSSVTQ